MNLKFLDCTFRVNRGKFLLAAKKTTVSSARDAVGNGCAPESYLHRIIFMGMMNELAVSPSCPPSDEVHFHIAQLFVTTLDDSDHGMQVRQERHTAQCRRELVSQRLTDYLNSHPNLATQSSLVKNDLRAG